MTKEEYLNLKKNSCKNKSDNKFDVVLSNPPYQISIGKKRQQVYPDFYMIGRCVAEKLSMIFPIGWQISEGKGPGLTYHKSMRNDNALQTVNNYYENKNSPIQVFPEANTGGVSIVYADEFNKSSSTVRFYEYGELIDSNKDMNIVKYWSDETQKIFNKIEKWVNESNIPMMNKSVTGYSPFFICGYYTNPERSEFSSISKESFLNSVPFWAKNKNNADSDYNKHRLFYLPIDFENEQKTRKLKTKNIEKYKVVFPKSGANRVWRDSFVLEPGVAFSDEFICIYTDSAHRSENIQSLLRTFYTRFAVSERVTNQNAYSKVYEYVPNLSTITNPRTGKVGWDSDWTDEDLKILFKDVLTDEDWEYIEKTALASDGGRK